MHTVKLLQPLPFYLPTFLTLCTASGSFAVATVLVTIVVCMVIGIVVGFGVVLTNTVVMTGGFGVVVAPCVAGNDAAVV